MKRGILLVIMMWAVVCQAQVQAPKGLQVGTTIIDANEVKSLDGVTAPLQTQLNGKLDVSAGITFALEDSLLARYTKVQANRSFGRRIYASNVQVVNTGNTTENTVITFTIPAGTLGPNGSLHFNCLYKMTSSTNQKEFKVKIGTSQIGYWTTTSTGVSARENYEIHNRNSLTAQVSSANGVASGGTFNTAPQSNDIGTYSINFGIDQTCTVTIKNGLGTETLSVEFFECIAFF